MSQTMQGAQVEYQAGTLIFQEGDPGGDLYFIKEGEIEVFRHAGGRDIRLATLRAGEVLGIMTCLTRDARLASARAVTDARVLLVKQAGIHALITTTPPWVNTVIRDFILRVKNMDELYTGAVERLAQVDGRPSLLWTAVQLAGGLGEVGALLAPEGADESTVVDVDRALAHMAKILDVPRGRVDLIFQIFLAVGLLRADPETAVKRAELGVLTRLSAFADLARRYVEDVDVRERYEALESSHRSFLATLPELARRERVLPTEPWRRSVKRLVSTDDLAAFVTEALDRAAAAGLVEMDGGGEHALVVFTPATLATAVRSLIAITELRVLDADAAAFAADAHPRSARVLSESY